MNDYIVNIERNNKDRSTRIVEIGARTAQEAHKSVLFKINLDEHITEIFRKSDGRRVFVHRRGFSE